MKLFAFVTACGLIAIGYFVGWATSLCAALFIFLCALFRKASRAEQKDSDWLDQQW